VQAPPESTWLVGLPSPVRRRSEACALAPGPGRARRPDRTRWRSMITEAHAPPRTRNPPWSWRPSPWSRIISGAL